MVKGDKYDDTLLVGRSATFGRSAGSVVRGIWHAFLAGAAMYGAAMHGSNLGYFRPDIVSQQDKE
jgi:hypothetical protein